MATLRGLTRVTSWSCVNSMHELVYVAKSLTQSHVNLHQDGGQSVEQHNQEKQNIKLQG
jgi:hypothetical protein